MKEKMVIHKVSIFASSMSHLLTKHALASEVVEIGFVCGIKQVQTARKTTDLAEDLMEITLHFNVQTTSRYKADRLERLDLEFIKSILPKKNLLGWYMVRKGIAFPSVEEIDFTRKLKELQPEPENELLFVLISGKIEPNAEKRQTDIGFFKTSSDKKRLIPLNWNVGNISQSSADEYSQRWFSSTSHSSELGLKNAASFFDFSADPLHQCATGRLEEFSARVKTYLENVEFNSASSEKGKEFFPSARQ